MKIIILEKEHLKDIENNYAVICGLQLLRVLRTIRYHQKIYLFISNQKGESLGHLQWFLIAQLAASLYEGVKKLFEMMSASGTLFAGHIKDKRVVELHAEMNRPESFLKSILAPIRDKIAYHYDEIVTKEMIKKMADECLAQGNDYRVISADTIQIKDMQFPSADQLEIKYILDRIPGADDREKVKNMSQDLLPLLEKFTLLVEEIAGELISPYGTISDTDMSTDKLT